MLGPGGRATESKVVQRFHGAKTGTKPTQEPPGPASAKVPNRGTAIPPRSHPHSTRCPRNHGEGSVRWKTRAEKYLLVVQQQHDRVQLFAGPIVRAKGDDEVIQSVPCRLRRNNNQFVLKPVGFGVFKAVVLAALCGGRRRGDSARGPRPPTHRPAPGGAAAPPYLVQPQAAERGFLGQKVAQSWGAPNVGGVRWVALHVPAAERKIQQRGWESFPRIHRRWEKHLKAADPGLKHVTGKCFATLSCSSWRFSNTHIFGNHFCYATGHEIAKKQRSQHGGRRRWVGPSSAAEGQRAPGQRGDAEPCKEAKKPSLSIFRVCFGEEIF